MILWAIIIVATAILIWQMIVFMQYARGREYLDHPNTLSSPLSDSTQLKPQRRQTDMAQRKLITEVKPYDEMTDEEKIDYVVYTYFTGEHEKTAEFGHDMTAKDDAYINSLEPKRPPAHSVVDDPSCTDDFDDCSKWAADGECEINPSFMLYSCRKSCRSCQLSEQEKFNLVKIYNSKPPKHCVKHEPYPDRVQYLRQFEDINSDFGAY